MGGVLSHGHIDNRTRATGLGWPWPEPPTCACSFAGSTPYSTVDSTEVMVRTWEGKNGDPQT
jgi:hypothetical protein